MNVRTLRSKAQNSTLEVEDILKASAEKQLGLSEELQFLSAHYEWSMTGVLPDGGRVQPLAKWAEVASAYSSGGFKALTAIASTTEDAPFVLSLLEKIGSAEALSFLIQSFGYVIEKPSESVGLAVQIASTLNLMLSFQNRPPVSSSQAANLQAFLLKLFPLAETENHQATVVLALRGVGDDIALRFVSELPAFRAPWSEVTQVSKRAIQKRLREKTH